MTEEYGLPIGFSRSDYRGMINYEGILAHHVVNMMKYSDNDPKQYCSSIETFIRWCPDDIRKKALTWMKEKGIQRRVYKEINEEHLVIYDDLIIYINELLERKNIIFRTGTFEIGHD